jgi:hypothetical protein
MKTFLYVVGARPNFTSLGPPCHATNARAPPPGQAVTVDLSWRAGHSALQPSSRGNEEKAMNRMRSSVFAVVAAAFLCVALCARARPVPSTDKGDSTRNAKLLTIKPAKIKGTVLYSDGKTPAAKVPVRLWSIEKKKFIHESTTDQDGAYELPKLTQGRYIAIFGDRMRLDVVVDEAKGQATEKFKVIIPRGRPQVTRKQLATELARVGPAYPAGGQFGGGLGSLLRNRWVIAGAVATAIAVPVALHNRGSNTGDGDDEGGRRRRRRRTIVSP